jgi:predicted phosphate transport protein (TIGR00153 family)
MLGFLRRDPTFFDMFSEIAKNLLDGSRALVDLFDKYDSRSEKTTEIKKFEHVGDELTHSVLRKLNQTFITPFDREDIHHLASSLDDVLDLMNAAAERTWMYKIVAPPPAAARLSQLILAQCEELGYAVAHLRQNGDVLDRCIEIKRLENQADSVSREAIGKLFEVEKDPLTLIKTKELLEVLETATDKAEDAANVLETVILKNT